MRKKALLLTLVILLSFLLGVFASAAYAPTFDGDIKSEAVYIINLDTGTPVYERNIHTPRVPASLTKIMSAIIVLENVDDLEEIAKAQSYMYEEFVGINISHAGITAGEEVRIIDLLHCMLLQSANEAANIAAAHVGDGDISKFVDMMNEKAYQLGARNTHFANAHGLHDPSQTTTAYDMMLIVRYAMQFELFNKIVEKTSYEFGPTNKHDSIVLSNRNDMMKPESEYYYSPISGIKTGTLEESGRCLISYAAKDGYEYAMVLMGAPFLDEDGETVKQRYDYTETRRLYEWCFNTFKVKTVIALRENAGEIPVDLAQDKESIRLVSAEEFSMLLPDEILVSSIVRKLELINPRVEAPVAKGDEMGYMILLHGIGDDGVELGRVTVIAAEEAERSTLKSYISQIEGVFKSFWMKFAVILIILLLVLYIAVMIIRNYNRRRYTNVKRRRRL